MNLDVSRKTIPDVLTLLEDGEWQVPEFQREFIWTQAQVLSLLTSIFEARPIGMITSWVQPQGKPSTQPERLKIKDVAFGKFIQNPAVIKLILDGKQRLTTLAMAFGGLRAPDDRYSFSGSWFLNFSADPRNSSDNIIIYKRISQISSEGLDKTANCIAGGLLRLDQYKEFNLIAQRIFDKTYYPQNKVPSEEMLQKRSTNLAEYLSTFTSFQIPVAELPASVSLAEVCDIFELLNTTGTKVSTFDLIHNLVFGDTKGVFNLREKFKECADSSEKIQLLADESRPEFFCQLVTGCYLSTSVPVGRTPKPGKISKVGSVKGGDLIETPTEFYLKFFDEIAHINSSANAFFNDILRADFRLKEIPYPVSAILYFSLRWKMEKNTPDQEKCFSIDELNSFYRAFFWRNVLTNRYDQGFLTLFSTDLHFITNTLRDLISMRGTDAWFTQANEKLTEYFGSQYPVRSSTQLGEILKDGEIRGAIRQAVILYLYSQTKYDLLTGETLNRFTQDRKLSVDLHHIFPKQWCKNNSGEYAILREQPTISDSLANLVPLTASSNNDWKTKSPATALKSCSWDVDKLRFEMALIDRELFEVLKSAPPNPKVFWDKRAQLIATRLEMLQKASR